MTIINPLIIPPAGGRAYNHITPFTYRDGLTYIEVLESLRAYIRDVVAPAVDAMGEFVLENIAAALDDVQDSIDASQLLVDQKIAANDARVDAAVQQVINSAIVLQDAVLAGILDNPASASRLVSDDLYASTSELATALADTEAAVASALADTEAAVAAEIAVVNNSLNATNSRVDTFEVAVPDRETKIGRLQHALSKASRAAVNMAWLGSSSTVGSGVSSSRRYVNLVHQCLSSNLGYTRYMFPVESVTDTNDSNFGIHSINGGISGSRSENFLSAQVVAMLELRRPIFVGVQIGSNDWSGNVSLTTYEANLRTALTVIRAAVNRPTTIAFIHSQPRMDVVRTTPWAAYADVMRKVANGEPDVIMIDCSKPFLAAGIPSTNSEGYLLTDLIHLTVEGNELLANEVVRQLGVAPRALALEPLRDVDTILTSDTFTGAQAEVAGRSSDAILGGDTAVWESININTFIEVSGSAIRPNDNTNSGSRFVGLPIPAGVTAGISFSIQSMPEAGGFYLDLHRQSLDISPSPDSIRVTLAPTHMTVTKRVGGSDVEEIYRRDSLFTNRTYTVVNSKDRIRVFVGGVEVARKPGMGLNGGWAGVARSSNAGGAFDSFILFGAR